MNFQNILILKKKKLIKNKFDRNFNSYGYHFVNSSWKPHCTIASVSKAKSKNEVFEEFLKNKKYFLKNLNLFIFMSISEENIIFYGSQK